MAIFPLQNHIGRWRIKEQMNYVTKELVYELNKTSIEHTGHSSLQEFNVFELRQNVWPFPSLYSCSKVSKKKAECS
jgi:hypothetical protein